MQILNLHFIKCYHRAHPHTQTCVPTPNTKLSCECETIIKY